MTALVNPLSEVKIASIRFSVRKRYVYKEKTCSSFPSNERNLARNEFQVSKIINKTLAYGLTGGSCRFYGHGRHQTQKVHTLLDFMDWACSGISATSSSTLQNAIVCSSTRDGLMLM